jgi:hypothetical protein
MNLKIIAHIWLGVKSFHGYNALYGKITMRRACPTCNMNMKIASFNLSNSGSWQLFLYIDSILLVLVSTRHHIDTIILLLLSPDDIK